MAKKLPVDHTPICDSADIRRIDPIWVDKAVPRGFWRQPQNRRDYLLWLGGKLGFCRMSDWYRLTYQDMAKHHGSGLANIWWHSSPVEAVQKCFPAYDWEEWQFVQVPMAFWTTPHNRRRYMAWLGRQLGFRQAEDWYQVTTVDFQRHRGGTLLLRYRSSVSATVKACFPDYDWKEWLFGMLPAGFWDEPRHCRASCDGSASASAIGVSKTGRGYAGKISGRLGASLIARYRSYEDLLASTFRSGIGSRTMGRRSRSSRFSPGPTPISPPMASGRLRRRWNRSPRQVRRGETST